MRSSFGHPTLPNVIGSFFFIYSFIYFLLFFLESPENKFYLRIFLMTYDVTYMRCVCVFPLYRQAWDLAVDICLSQLPTIIEEGTAFRVSVCVRDK